VAFGQPAEHAARPRFGLPRVTCHASSSLRPASTISG
jgi:hypothetical protein